MTRDTEAIFLAALEKETPEGRVGYIEGACAGDPELLHHVRELLEAHEELRGPLDSPPAEVDLTLDLEGVEKIGSQIGPYKLLQELGRGGMGIVYMAEQTEPVARRVALKVIKPGMDTGQVIARFEVERQALAMMDHPNIAKVLDAGATESGRLYFVMELVKGIPITQYCDEQHLAPRERLQLFVKVCQAIQHAHQKGIIHRDLKPTNVLVAEFDQQAIPKIIDFGVAKATNQKLTEKTMFTQFGQIMGTLEYMSPEQAKLNQLDIDTRSDVYSLGVLLYELLTGDTPFDRKRLHSAAFEEMLRIIREEEPPKPSTRLSGSNDRLTIAKRRAETPDRLGKLVKGDLDWIAMKALEKDRGRRYETAASFAADIERFLGDQAVEARPPSRVYLVRKFVRRNRGPVIAATALLLAMVAGILATSAAAVIAVRARDEADKQRSLAEEQRAVALSANEQVREFLVHQAYAAANSGDHARTEKLIQEAEVVGASEAQVEIIRGSLAAVSFENRSRILEPFHRATQLDPESVAAWSLLAHFSWISGNPNQALEAIGKAKSLPAVSAEDHLFLGFAEVFVALDFESGIGHLENGLALHDSGFGRLQLAQALAFKAIATRDERDIGQAIREFQRGRSLTGDIGNAAWTQMWVHDVAVGFARQRKANDDEVAKLVATAADGAARVKTEETSLFPLIELAFARHYDWIENDPVNAERHFHRAVEKDPTGEALECFAGYLLRRYGIERATTLLQDHSSLAADCRGLLLALTQEGREAAERTWADELAATPSARSILVPLLLGKTDQVREGYSRLLQDSEDPEQRVLAEYIVGERDQSALLQSETATDPHFYIAVHSLALAKPDTMKAKEHFRISAEAVPPYPLDLATRWSAAFLEQMENNPGWP